MTRIVWFVLLISDILYLSTAQKDCYQFGIQITRHVVDKQFSQGGTPSCPIWQLNAHQAVTQWLLRNREWFIKKILFYFLLCIVTVDIWCSSQQGEQDCGFKTQFNWVTCSSNTDLSLLGLQKPNTCITIDVTYNFFWLLYDWNVILYWGWSMTHIFI